MVLSSHVERLSSLPRKQIPAYIQTQIYSTASGFPISKKSKKEMTLDL